MPVNLNELYPSLRSKFEKTGDYRYVLVAIAEHPSEPPEWALKVCADLLEEYRTAVESFDDARRGGPKRKTSREDGRRLVEVARLVRAGKSKTAAMQQVTGEDVDGPAYKRLMRAWNRNTRPSNIFLPGKPRRETNKWLSYVIQEEREEYMQTVFKQAWKELREGNFDVQVDSEAEQRRLEAARWVRLAPPDASSEDEAGELRIAPHPSFEVMVKLAKRWLLKEAAEAAAAEDDEEESAEEGEPPDTTR